MNAEHTAHGLSAAVSYQEPAHISVKGPCYFTVDQSLVDDPAHKLMAVTKTDVCDYKLLFYAND